MFPGGSGLFSIPMRLVRSLNVGGRTFAPSSRLSLLPQQRRGAAGAGSSAAPASAAEDGSDSPFLALARALLFEKRKHFVNMKGSTKMFHEAAADHLSSCAARLPDPDDARTATVLSQYYQEEYSHIDPSGREVVVDRTLSLCNAWMKQEQAGAVPAPPSTAPQEALPPPPYTPIDSPPTPARFGGSDSYYNTPPPMPRADTDRLYDASDAWRAEVQVSVSQGDFTMEIAPLRPTTTGPLQPETPSLVEDTVRRIEELVQDPAAAAAAAAASLASADDAAGPNGNRGAVGGSTSGVTAAPNRIVLGSVGGSLSGDDVPDWLSGGIFGEVIEAPPPPALLSFEGSAAKEADRERREAELLASGSGLEQRTEEWRRLRGDRLTASSFASALGFFSGSQTQLWEEKVGLAPPFTGNEATRWGERSEAGALSDYASIIGRSVRREGFRVLAGAGVPGWMGASPDGIIMVQGGAGGDGSDTAAPQGPGMAPCDLTDLMGPGEGILEVKCPHNNGAPGSAKPWDQPPGYYMPQVQGLMEIFDMEWAHLYCWTENGSAIYHIQRDREYWCQAWALLAQFWYNHVVPAREALARNDPPAVVRAAHRPPNGKGGGGVDPEGFRRLEAATKVMVARAPRYQFPPLHPPSRTEGPGRRR